MRNISAALLLILLPLAPASGQTPEQARWLEIANQGRARVGMPSYVWDDRLGRSAQDWAEAGAAGKVDFKGGHYHAGSYERITATGFPVRVEQVAHRDGLRRPKYYNISEDMLIGLDPSRSSDAPEEQVRRNVRFLVEDVARWGPYEGHIFDFRCYYDRIGIGQSGGVVVFQYGRVAPGPGP